MDSEALMKKLGEDFEPKGEPQLYSLPRTTRRLALRIYTCTHCSDFIHWRQKQNYLVSTVSEITSPIPINCLTISNKKTFAAKAGRYFVCLGR